MWVRRRTTIVDGRPHQLADSYSPLDLAVGTLLTEEWSARMLTSPESVSLQLPGGTPVIDLTRTIYDSKGRAVEVMLAVIAADTVRLFYRFPIPD